VTKRSFLWARGRPIWSFLFSPKGRNGNAVSVRLSRAVISNTARAYFGSPESYKKLFVSHGDVHDADAAGEPFSGSDLLLSAACSNETLIAADTVGGRGFAVDASLIAADVNKQRSVEVRTGAGIAIRRGLAVRFWRKFPK
jgi:hypothetical protein